MSSIHASFQKTRQGNEDVRYQLWVKMTTLFFSVLLYHSQSHFRVTQSISQTHRCILASLERIFLQRTRTQYIGAIPCICQSFNAFPFLWGSTVLGSYYTRCGRFLGVKYHICLRTLRSGL